MVSPGAKLLLIVVNPSGLMPVFLLGRVAPSGWPL
jgi:hypothetical protein